MNTKKAILEYFELIEELIQTGASKNLKHQIITLPAMEKLLECTITVAVVPINSMQTHFQFGWKTKEESFRGTKIITLN